MPEANVIAITAISISIFGLIFQYFGWIIGIKTDMAKLSDRLVSQETKMELFWKSVSISVATLIKQPIHFRKDELMDKLKLDMQGNKGVINEVELVELRKVLSEEVVELEGTKDPRSLAYALALAYINQLLTIKM
jgi:hypothetical protein